MLSIRFLRRFWRVFNPVTLGVRLILVQDGKVLLVQHTYDDRWWCLPGGGVVAQEILEAAARREVKEELGAALGELRLEGVFSNFREGKSDHVVVFSCTDCIVPGRENLKIGAWRFFAPDHLPEHTFLGHRRRIEEYFQADSGLRTGEW